MSRSDALLHTTHIDGERWLIPDSGRNAAKKSAHFGTSLSETEDAAEDISASMCGADVMGHTLEHTLVNHRGSRVQTGDLSYCQ